MVKNRKWRGAALAALVLTIGLLAGCGGGGSVKLDLSGVTLESFMVNSELASMRPIAAASDNATVYVGYIKSADPLARGVAAINTSDGSQKWLYNPGYDCYTKGIATDDRGNVYVGIAHAPSENTVSIDILGADGKKTAGFDISEAGEFGVNGLTVARSGDTYTLYVVTNYGPNRIYAYNVTDVKAAAPDTAFGSGGMVNLKTLTGNDACEGNYIKADAEGNLYLTANLGNGNKGDCVLKITNKGAKAEKAFECGEAYGIDIDGGYIFVSTYEGAASHLYAYKENGYAQAMKVDAIADSNNYAGVAYQNCRLYVTDQAYKDGSRLLRTSVLTGK